MKYREEVVAKIFNYITVIVLLGIIAFEAYMLQSERNRMQVMEQENAQLNADLIDSREINYDLRVENIALEKLSTQWKDYAAFTDTNKLDRFQKDLFGRTELIPQQAIEKIRKKKLEEMIEYLQKTESGENTSEENEEVQEAEDTQTQEDETQQTEETIEELYERYEIKAPVFSFADSQGDSVFLPFAYSEDPMRQYLIYTCAYSENGEIISLLYELPMNRQRSAPRYNEERKIDWRCIAYDLGDGWESCLIPENIESEETE